MDVHLAGQRRQRFAMRIGEPGLVLGQRLVHCLDTRLGVPAGAHHGLHKLVEGESVGVAVRLSDILGFSDDVDERISNGQSERILDVVEVISRCFNELQRHMSGRIATHLALDRRALELLKNAAPCPSHNQQVRSQRPKRKIRTQD